MVNLEATLSKVEENKNEEDDNFTYIAAVVTSSSITIIQSKVPLYQIQIVLLL
jgi:hypothetical protein